MTIDLAAVRRLIRDVPDFPKPGVLFRDITPLLADPVAFGSCVDALAEPFVDQRIDKVLGIEARGFIVAAPIALRLGAGFVPVRKAGKLPWKVVREAYQLEYGVDNLELHEDALAPGERALIVDDVLATGGTGSAVIRLVQQLRAEPVGLACLLELADLGGRGKLGGVPAVCLLEYR